jgi:beta-lactamase regulating signal transducer with metallopeptidase domain
MIGLDSLPARLLTLALLHGAWIGLLTAGLAALALRIVPTPWRRVRHAILLASLGVVALVPVLATVLHIHNSADAPQEQFPAMAVGQPPAAVASVVQPLAALPPGTQPPSAVVADPITLRVAQTIDRVQPVLLAAWLMLAGPLLGRVGLGLLAGRRRWRSARDAADPLQMRCETLARRLGLRRVPRVRVHPRADEPCLCGPARPGILLPEAWLDTVAADPAHIDAVLAHELAHARRHDLPVILLQRLVEAAWWFHPAVRWVSRSLDDHRERCADALAASVTGNRLALAESLEALARWRLERLAQRPMRLQRKLLGAWLGGPVRPLLSRIQEVLGMTPKREHLRWWALAAVPLALLAALFVASSGLAQSDPVAAAADDWPQFFNDLDVRGERVDHPADPNRQISYECHILHVTANQWRSGLENRLSPVEGHASEPVWILDEATQKAFFADIQDDHRSSIIMAPKITAFEGASASVDLSRTTPYVASVEPVVRPDGGVSFQPQGKELADGLQIAMRGTMQKGSSDLETTLHRTDLVRLDTVTVPAQGADSVVVNGSVQVPQTIEVHRQVHCALPEGSALLVSMGYRDERPQPTGMSRSAIDLLATLGIEVEPRRRTREILILLTPRHVILESEEEPLATDPNVQKTSAPQPQAP